MRHREVGEGFGKPGLSKKAKEQRVKPKLEQLDYSSLINCRCGGTAKFRHTEYIDGVKVVRYRCPACASDRARGT